MALWAPWALCRGRWRRGRHRSDGLMGVHHSRHRWGSPFWEADSRPWEDREHGAEENERRGRLFCRRSTWAGICV